MLNVTCCWEFVSST
ncbi:hypothetical protein Bhyg_16524 [Pseudolycoriella hygida]|uniref:Uncharacterized protein n=1 Tax=Pseudolycoriella hygida TaxID=35572 RepID=A0A9Q0ML64_9DIPT|nr:hypothetical protein Bhyg_16524 [Pseudolycoriella hygida]